MNYTEVIDFLFNQFPEYQKVGNKAYKIGLDNIISFDKQLNSPHKTYKTIHVAGTNGKGSVAHSLAAILQSAGYKVGLYTSPHLISFTERIRVNGQEINEDYVTHFVNTHYDYLREHQLSFFEVTTAMAFEYFKYSKVDFAVIEVGLGGRLDSTNIINPILSVITNIGLDHTSILGDTLELIAGEKAGIIKPSTPAVIGEQNGVNDVFKNKANEVGAPIIFAEKQYTIGKAILTDKPSLLLTIKNTEGLPFEVELGLTGYCQKKNAVTIMTAIEQIRQQGITIDDSAIRNGLLNVIELTGLRGRWQKIAEHPYTIIDTGHNEHAMSHLSIQIKETCKKYKQSHIIWGMSNDKRPSDVVKQLPNTAHYYFTQADTHRASNSADLEEYGLKNGLQCSAYPTVKEAIEAAFKAAEDDDFVFIGGSNFVVADALNVFKSSDNQWTRFIFQNI